MGKRKKMEWLIKIWWDKAPQLKMSSEGSWSHDLLSPSSLRMTPGQLCAQSAIQFHDPAWPHSRIFLRMIHSCAYNQETHTRLRPEWSPIKTKTFHPQRTGRSHTMGSVDGRKKKPDSLARRTKSVRGDPFRMKSISSCVSRILKQQNSSAEFEWENQLWHCGRRPASSNVITPYCQWMLNWSILWCLQKGWQIKLYSTRVV